MKIKPYFTHRISLTHRILSGAVAGMLTLTPFLLSSCKDTNDPFGGKSSTERVSEEMKNVREVLVAQKEGWVLKNVPGPNKNFGGYNILVKFMEDGTALATGEREAADGTIDWEKGSYEIRDDQGVVISFPSYLAPITYYADSDVGYGAGTGKGYQGDYGFVVQEITDDKHILVEGRTSMNKMELFVPDNGTPEEYLQRVMDYRSTASNFEALYEAKSDGWIGTLNGKEVLLITSPDYNRFVVADPNNPYAEQSFLSYFFGEDKLELVWPYSENPTPEEEAFINTTTLAPFRGVKSLSYNPETSVWTTDTGVEFRPHVDPEWDEYSKFLGQYLMQVPSTSLIDFMYVILDPGPNHTYIARSQVKENGERYMDYDLVFQWVTHQERDPETDEVTKEYKTLRLSGQNVVANGQSYELVVVSKAGRIWRGNRYGLEAVPAVKKDGTPDPGMLLGGAYTLTDNGSTGADPILGLITLRGNTPVTEGIKPWAILPGQTVLHKAKSKK